MRKAFLFLVSSALFSSFCMLGCGGPEVNIEEEHSPDVELGEVPPPPKAESDGRSNSAAGYPVHKAGEGDSLN